MTTWPIPRHWRSYDNDPLPTGKEVLDEPFRAFPLRFQAKDTTRATTAISSAVQCPGFLATYMVPMLFEPHALAKVLPETVGITATDVNETMLEQARSQPTNDTCAMAQAGPFFPDKQIGFREALRVLRPGHRYVFNVWDRIGEGAIAMPKQAFLVTALRSSD